MRTAGYGTSSLPTGPNQLWLTDITEHKTAEGKLYLCAIKDVFGNKIVGILDRLEDEIQPRGRTR